jgi:hypothetical protein
MMSKGTNEYFIKQGKDDWEAYLSSNSSMPAFPASQSTRTQLCTSSPLRYTSMVGSISRSTSSESNSSGSSSSFSSNPSSSSSSSSRNDFRGVPNLCDLLDDFVVAKPKAEAFALRNFVSEKDRASRAKFSSTR